MTDPSFAPPPCSLLTNPLIPVALPPGSTLGPMLSLRDLLAHAREIRGLDVGPLEEVAVLRRLLLPVVIDAYGQPATPAGVGELFRQGRFEVDLLDAYLDAHADRFNLFDPEVPFDQVGHLEALNGETKPSSLLIASVASGNNVPLFSSRSEGDPPALTPSQALLGMLSAQCWDTAAIKTGAVGDPQAKGGKTAGNPTGPVGQFGAVILRGRNLFETIVLNIPSLQARTRGVGEGDDLDEAPPSTDRPWWRRPPPTARWEVRRAEGVLDLLTWQARRIRLVPEETPDGLRVSRVILAAGDRLSETPDFEPHTQWRQNPRPKSGEPAHRPVRHQSGRAGWQGLQSLLALTWREAGTNKVKVRTTNLLWQENRLDRDGVLPVDYPLDVLTVGVEYGNMSAVVENVIADAIPLPIRALRDDEELHDAVLDVVDQAEDLRRALNHLSDDVRRASGGDAIPWDKGERPGDQALHSFDVPIRRFLADVRQDPGRLEEHRGEWQRAAWDIVGDAAEIVLDGAPPSTWLGRTRTDPRGKAHRDNVSSAAAKFYGARRKILDITAKQQKPEGVPA